MQMTSDTIEEFLDLLDGKRTRVVLGVTDLQVARRAGISRTAPSSLALFDKDGKVIWQAPPR